MNGQTAVVSVPDVIIPIDVWEKMMAYIRMCSTEINGFGYVDIVDGVLLVSDVFILEQFATEHEVLTTGETRAKFINELQNARLDPGRVKFQWHSHINGVPTIFSDIDLENIATWDGNLLISVVASNVSDDYTCRVDVRYRGLQFGMEVQPRFPKQIPQEALDAAAAEIAEKVTTGRRARPPRPVLHSRTTYRQPAHGLVVDPFSSMEGDEQR